MRFPDYLFSSLAVNSRMGLFGENGGVHPAAGIAPVSCNKLGIPDRLSGRECVMAVYDAWRRGLGNPSGLR
jgi:hypothetical protein